MLFFFITIDYIYEEPVLSRVIYHSKNLIEGLLK